MSPNSQNDEIAELKDEIRLLREQMSKESWKWFFEVFATPIVLALIAFFGSWYLQSEESKNTTELSSAQLLQGSELAQANLEAHAIETFLEAVISNSVIAIEIALKGLRYLPKDVALPYVSYVEDNKERLAIEALDVEQEQAEKILQKSIDEARIEIENRPIIKAKIDTPAGMNLREAPLTQQQLGETKTQPDINVGEVICTLPKGHPVSIIEDGIRWTIVETKCPNETKIRRGYISDFRGRPPFETF